MKIMLTGATGFVGHHIIKALQASHSFVATSRRTPDDGSPAVVNANLQVKHLDLAAFDQDSWEAALDGCAAVINCAAYGVNYGEQDPDLARLINERGPLRLFELCAARGIRYIHIGTSYEYGGYDTAIDEGATLQPIGLYGSSKAKGSEALLEYQNKHGGDLTILRIFGMYGPSERQHKLLPLVFTALSRRTPLQLASGIPIRDYVFVHDAVSAIEAALQKKGVVPSLYNVCSGQGLSIRQFVQEAARSFGEPIDSELLRWGSRPDRPNEIVKNVGNPSLAREHLGWMATTSLQQGLTHTAIEWKNAQ